MSTHPPEVSGSMPGELSKLSVSLLTVGLSAVVWSRGLRPATVVSSLHKRGHYLQLPPKVHLGVNAGIRASIAGCCAFVVYNSPLDDFVNVIVGRPVHRTVYKLYYIQTREHDSRN